MRLTKKAIHTSHDGCHISDYENFFEWWYFDFDLKNSHHIYVEWHAPILNIRDNFCTLFIKICTPDKVFSNHEQEKSKTSIIRQFRYPRSLIAQKETSCDIVFPSGHIVEKNDNYFININERDLLVDLRLRRLLPPVIGEDEVLYRTRDGKEFFSWNIPLPRAEVTGEIELSGERIEAQGTAYHDHNWGNLNIGKHLRGWIWARVLFHDFTLIFGDITPSESREKVQVLLLIDKDGRKLDISSLHVEYTDYKKHCNSFVPYNVLISCNNKKYRVHLRVENILTIQEFPLGSFENHLWNSFLAKVYYLFRLNSAPSFLKKWFGRSLYFQFVAKGELYADNVVLDTANGKLEVFSFGV
jgi:hypothetical protein